VLVERAVESLGLAEESVDRRCLSRVDRERASRLDRGPELVDHHDRMSWSASRGPNFGAVTPAASISLTTRAR